jgi:hypothetical protein
VTLVAMNTLGIESERWATGLTLAEFVDGIADQQDRAALERRLAEVRLTPEDSAAFARYTAPLWVLVLTESWCGDSLMNLPILARIVEATPRAAMRIFVRSEAPELTASYQERGVRNIPTFTFFDAEFRELGTWVERPQAAHERVAAWRAETPALAAILADQSLTAEERRARMAPALADLRDQMERWYAGGLQAATVAELRALLGVAR